MPLELLDRPEIAQVLFHPRPEFPPAVDSETARTVILPVAEGVTLAGRLYPAGPSAAPAILYFHGNGEIAADYDDLAPLYRQLGLTLLVIDYRGYGRSTGTPRAATLGADAVTAFERAPALLAEAGLKPARLLVMGRSLGSAAALAVAERAGPALAGLIIESGFAYTLALIERLGGIVPLQADEARDGFGNLARIGRVTVPTLIIHGERDWIIPFEEGHQLFLGSAATDKKLVPIANAGHNDLMMVGTRAYFSAIAALAAR